MASSRMSSLFRKVLGAAARVESVAVDGEDAEFLAAVGTSEDTPDEQPEQSESSDPNANSIVDGDWYYLARSTAVERLRFVPTEEKGDSGTVTVVYKSHPQEYDSVSWVPREAFYSLAFAPSVGKHLEYEFWPLYSSGQKGS